MRPKLLSVKNLVLLVLAIGIAFGLFSWLNSGGHLPWMQQANTAGKIAFVSDREGNRKHIFLMDGKDGSGVVRLTNAAKADDRQPAFSPDGAMITFTADRNGVVPQIYQMDASPGSRILQRTRTSSTKEQPQFVKGQKIYFLDGGKVANVSADSTDADAIFPTAEQKKVGAQASGPFAEMFKQGGLETYSVSPDGEAIASVLDIEGGQVLLVYFVNGGNLVTLGSARRVFATFAEDNSLVAAFVGGSDTEAPLPSPIDLYIPSSLSKEELETHQVPRLLGTDLLGVDTGEDADAGLMRLPPSSGGVNRVIRVKLAPRSNDEVQKLQNELQQKAQEVRQAVQAHSLASEEANKIFNQIWKASQTVHYSMEVLGGIQVPVEAQTFAPSPDGRRVALALTEGKAAGLYIEPLEEKGSGGRVTGDPAERPAWSPDGTRIAFVSKGDIFVAPTDGSAAPTNLTKGQGSNSNPVWSPQKPKGESGGSAAAATTTKP